MTRIEKGEFAYYDRQKKIEATKTTALFLLVAGVFLAGYLTVGSKKNLMTVVAILGVLPAARCAASAITRYTFRSIEESLYEKVRTYESRASVVYNMVFTAKEKTTQVDVIAVCGNMICGYTSSAKADTAYAEKHIRTILKGHKLTGQTIKLHKSEKAYLNWLSSLPERREAEETEQIIRQLLLNISL